MQKKYVKIVESTLPSSSCGRCGFTTILVGNNSGQFIGYKCSNCYNFEQGVRVTKIETPDNS